MSSRTSVSSFGVKKRDVPNRFDWSLRLLATTLAATTLLLVGFVVVVGLCASWLSENSETLDALLNAGDSLNSLKDDVATLLSALETFGAR